jgi:CBS domain-containing protein
MLVRDIMTPIVETCGPGSTLADAARIMWEDDCGFVPVVDPATGRLCGVLTDRDACMAAWDFVRPLTQITVSSAMTPEPVTVGEWESVAAAHLLFREHQVRRLPVVDRDGSLRGVLSLSDLACCEDDPGEVAVTLREISRQRFPAIP